MLVNTLPEGFGQIITLVREAGKKRNRAVLSCMKLSKNMICVRRKNVRYALNKNTDHHILTNGLREHHFFPQFFTSQIEQIKNGSIDRPHLCYKLLKSNANLICIVVSNQRTQHYKLHLFHLFH